jgi:hypothetical protein
LEIQSLRLLVTEQDLNDLTAGRLPLDEEVRQVRFRIAPEGIYVSGVYHMLVKVAFETLWEVEVSRGNLVVRLSGFKALGIPVMLLRSMVMTALSQAVDHLDAVQVEGETVLVDVDRLLEGEGIPVRTNLTAVHCLAGQMVMEAAGIPPGGIEPPPGI